jgi:hypothetical protein
MRSMSRALMAFVMVAASSVLLTDCTKLNVGGSGALPPPSASPSPSPSGSPAPCATMNPTPNDVVVGMYLDFAPASPAPYGSIAGYAVIDLTGSSAPPTTAEIINTTISGAPITSSNVLQFFNLEPEGSSVVHSAVGFPSATFPQTPYTFPSPDASPTADAIVGGKPWSTGLIFSPATGVGCFSQTFTLTPGTYHFGDFTYYNSGMRDVLVVGTPVPDLRKDLPMHESRRNSEKLFYQK